ncbi:hypothetical protein GOODEAATRI_005940, partial [Goodea atripinnis]
GCVHIPINTETYSYSLRSTVSLCGKVKLEDFRGKEYFKIRAGNKHYAQTHSLPIKHEFFTTPTKSNRDPQSMVPATVYIISVVFQGPPTADNNLHIIAHKRTNHSPRSFPSLYPMGGLSGNDGLRLPCQQLSRAADCSTANESQCRRAALKSA